MKTTKAKTWMWSVVLVAGVSAAPARAASDDLIQSRVTADSEALKGITIVGNLTSAIWGTADLEVRGRISPRVQWVAGGSVGFTGSNDRLQGQYVSFNGTSDASNIDATLDVGMNFFLLGHAPSGLWFGPRLGASYLGGRLHSVGTGTNTDGSTYPFTWDSRGVGFGGTVAAMIGFTQVLKPGLTLEVAAGPQATFTTNLQDDNGGLSHDLSTTYGVKTWVGLGWTL